MGRPEWIVVALVLSVGLVGATVSAGPGLDSSGEAVEPAGPIEPVHDATDAAGVGESDVLFLAASGLATGPDQFDLRAQQEFERSTFRVRIGADGDAVWQFRYERPIESDDDRAAFRRYAERVRTEETDLYRNFRNQSRELTAAASTETGRSMDAENVTRDAGIDQTPTQEEGYVELSFEWTNFGRVEDGTVVVGDVFEGGLYLGETQSLIYAAGDGVSFRSVDPEGSPSSAELPESESVTWTGEQQFADRHPRAVLATEGASGGSDTGASMLWLVGGGVIGLLLVAVLVIARYDVFPDAELPGSGSLPGSNSSASSPAGASPSAAGENPGAAEASTETSPVPPEEPLSDERRVQQLLEDGDGRMKQTAIVEETEWSKSKVSMLLSEMEEEGTIRKIQVGRENIIALDGHEPEAASSPFDDAE